MKISFYEGNIGNTKKATIIDIPEFLNYVRYEKFKPLAQRVAAIKDKKERQKVKSQILPYVTISGVFSQRNNGGLLEYSGFIAIDIDGVSLDFRKQLEEDEHTFALFLSVSGNGFCILVRTSKESEFHLNHFLWLEQYYYDKYGIVIDASCKDVSRPRYVSSDPKIYINEKSKAAGRKKIKQAPKNQVVNWIATESQMDRIVGEIVSRGIDLVDSYDDWLKCGAAIAHGYGEDGRQYFHAVSSLGTKYNAEQCDKKYNNLLKTTKGKAQIGTFFWMAKNAGIELRTKQEEKAFANARAAKKNFGKVEDAVSVAGHLGIDLKLQREVAEAVFKNPDINISDKNIPLIEEIAGFIKMNYQFERNEINRYIYDIKTNRILDDTILNTIYIQAKSKIGNDVTQRDIQAIIHSELTPNFNPFQNFIDTNLDYYNFTEESAREIVAELIDTIPLKTPETAIFIIRWLLGIPATIQGQTVRLVLAFIGGQETGKTEWFRRLLPLELKPYFAESNLMRDKDDEIAMTQNLIILDDEMSGKSKKDISKFKELTSKEWFTLREPYGRTQVKLKRLSLLCATSNDHQVVNDSTGNTRILPVEFYGAYDFEAFNEIDKTKLFCALWYLFSNGLESWQLLPEEKDLLGRISTENESICVERELLLKYFSTPKNEDENHFMTSTEIKTIIEIQSSQRNTNMVRLGIELRKMFPRVLKKINGTPVYGYFVNPLTTTPNVDRVGDLF